MRRLTLIVVAAVLAGTLVSTARTAGGPSLGENGGLRGIATSTGFRYVAIQGQNRTVLARISPQQRVAAVRFFRGNFTIAGVAYDGATSGLSADGKTLVLVGPRYSFPRARTSFLILALPGMFVRQAVTLGGDFSFDAVSPDGSMLYFIQYLSRRDPTKYAVRAFDREGGRLVSKPVVDKSEPDEAMRGMPISRAMGRDGRWAYTLYDGGGGTPFVHALDTLGVEAHCIDLAELAGRDDLFTLRLRLRGANIAVVKAERPLLLVDSTTFRVSSSQTEPASADGGSTPWAPIGMAAGALLAAGALSLALVRRRRAATT
jgi:hypothetical protein